MLSSQNAEVLLALDKGSRTTEFETMQSPTVFTRGDCERIFGHSVTDPLGQLLRKITDCQFAFVFQNYFTYICQDGGSWDPPFDCQTSLV